MTDDGLGQSNPELEALEDIGQDVGAILSHIHEYLPEIDGRVSGIARRIFENNEVGQKGLEEFMKNVPTIQHDCFEIFERVNNMWLLSIGHAALLGLILWRVW